MKKFIAITLIFLYSYSFVRTYIPVVYKYVSKTVWKISFSQKVKNLPPRANILSLLQDMAKHNTTKQSNTPQPDSISQSFQSFFCLIPKHNHSFTFDETEKAIFLFYIGNVPFVFRKNATPPPKVA